MSFDDSHNIYYDIMQIKDQVVLQIQQKAREEQVTKIWSETEALSKISDLMKEACKEANNRIDHLYTNEAHSQFAKDLKASVSIDFYKELKPTLRTIFKNSGLKTSSRI